MKTDDLIDCLATDLPARSAGRLRRGLALAAAPAALAAFAGLLLTLGVRPDLPTAVLGGVFWSKAVYTAALGLAGFWLLDRAGRPGAGLRAPLIAAALIIGLAGAAGLMQVLGAADRQALLLEGSSRVCSLNIAGLSVLVAPLLALAARRFAPVRPGLAGAALGLLVGGLAATVYGLHCPEREAAFIALWYTLGVAAPVAAGALAGRLIWRW